VDGEPVGQVYYNDIQFFEGKKRTELDLWMRAERTCGRGYGSDALDALCTYLAAEFAVQEFMVQPSARNPRAIRAYEKIGFRRLPLPPGNGWAGWPRDYHDSIYMVKTIPLFEGAGPLKQGR
jgi:RimJ/RimL family protein N-acetyltransferase